MSAPDSNPSSDPTAHAVGCDECSAGLLLADTRIDKAGVMRCCLATVAEEYEGKDGQPDQKVALGMKSQCRHCKEPFTLVAASPYPKWTPDRFISQNDPSAGTAPESATPKPVKTHE